MKHPARNILISITALLPLASLCACISPEESRRRYVRDVSQSLTLDAMPRDEAIAKNMKLLAGDAHGSREPTLRWQAAQTLGALQAWQAYDLLWEKSLSANRDASAAVRRECINALGKLPYEERVDEGDRQAIGKRARLISTLEAHLRRRSSEFTESGTFTFEDDNAVLLSMMGALITLGLPEGYHPDFPEESAGQLGRSDVALALLDVAGEFDGGVKVQQSLATYPFAQNVSDGLYESAVGGVFTMLGIPPKEAARLRLGWVNRSGTNFSSRPWEDSQRPQVGQLPADRTSLGVSRTRLVAWLRVQVRDAPFTDR